MKSIKMTQKEFNRKADRILNLMVVISIIFASCFITYQIAYFKGERSVIKNQIVSYDEKSHEYISFYKNEVNAYYDIKYYND